MKTLDTICKTVVWFLSIVAVLLAGCGRPPKPVDIYVDERQEDSPSDLRGFDPLELSADKEIVPGEYPQATPITTRSEFSQAGSTPVPVVLSTETPSTGEADSRDGQVFRVQIFTDKVYGASRRAVAVAREIFDREVYLDYEVPYYKVRVGGFGLRSDAEDYQMRAKAAGYSNAWVVAVNVSVKELDPLYPAEPVDSPDGYVPEGKR